MELDYIHKWTDKKLDDLEKTIARQYRQPIKEARRKIDEYLDRFADLPPSEYKRIMSGSGWQALINTLVMIFHATNINVTALIHNTANVVYAENYDYGTFEVESGVGVDTQYTLRDSDKVHPPKEKPAKKRDTTRNRQLIQSVMLGLLLSGRDLKTVSTQLSQTVGKRNVTAMTFSARNIITAAENAGRADSYQRAEEMGIEGIKEEWIATLDEKTRHTHRILDGQRVNVGQPFYVEGYTIKYPGDPAAEPEMRCNCRCRLVCMTGDARFIPNLGKGGVREKIEVQKKKYIDWKNEKVR